MSDQKEPSSRAERTRRRLIEAAAQLFGQQGYAGTTTRSIAEAADVTEVTLFRHFGSKENLLDAVIEQYAGPALNATWQAHLSGDYRQDLLQLAQLLMRSLLERKEALRLMFCETGTFPELRERMARNPRQMRQLLAQYLQQQMKRGLVRDDLHPEAMAQAFLGMCLAYSISLGILHEPLPDMSTEELVRHFVDLFVRGTVTPEALERVGGQHA